MKDIYLGRRDFLKYTGLVAGSVFLDACASPILKPTISPTETMKPSNTPQPTRTSVPSNTPEKVTSTSIPERKKPLDERFSLGSFKIAKTGLKIRAEADLLNVTNGVDEVDTSIAPLTVTTDYIPYDEDGGIGTAFAKSAEKGGGKLPLLFLTDNPKILLLYTHCEAIGAPGERIRKTASFVLHNPDKKNDIIGKKMSLESDDGRIIEGSIEFIRTIPELEWDDGYSDKRLWGLQPTQDNIVFFINSNAAIPDEIINNPDPKVRYLIIATCTPQDGDPIDINPFDPNRLAFNTAMRSYIVLKFTNL